MQPIDHAKRLVEVTPERDPLAAIVGGTTDRRPLWLAFSGFQLHGDLGDLLVQGGEQQERLCRLRVFARHRHNSALLADVC